jgi:hypothetical protein
VSVTKAVVGLIVSLIVVAVGLSLAMIPLGKPTPWQLIGAPDVVNSQNLIKESGEPDFPWTVHLNDVSVGLLPCEGFESAQPLAGDIGTFCSEAQDIELENSATGTVLRIGKTSYHYDCEADGVIAANIAPLLRCEVNAKDSIFS